MIQCPTMYVADEVEVACNSSILNISEFGLENVPSAASFFDIIPGLRYTSRLQFVSQGSPLEHSQHCDFQFRENVWLS